MKQYILSLALSIVPLVALPKDEEFVSDSGYRGVIDDPDGYVNVRADKRADAPIVAKVKTGEPFSFECKHDDE